ncbi:MAG: hypothetical protein E5V25_27830, partial [Mesorhizobium sp.]
MDIGHFLPALGERIGIIPIVLIKRALKRADRIGFVVNKFGRPHKHGVVKAVLDAERRGGVVD